MQKNAKLQRARRTRSKLKGTKSIPRLSVYRSNKFIYVQLIDDTARESILAVSEKDISVKGKKSERAFEIGKHIAKKALTKKIKKVIFDKGSYAYHGRVQQVAEGARKEGLEF